MPEVLLEVKKLKNLIIRYKIPPPKKEYLVFYMKNLYNFNN